jgi:thiaminase/transcriptional activator TenA
MSFTRDVWEAAAPLRAAMCVMPFNVELATGRLPREKFKYYMQQDSLYLQGYARVLALGAAKAPDADAILEFSKASETAIVVERALHAGYLSQFGISQADMEAGEASPTCEAYVNFMLAEAAIGTYATLIAAVLPCFWVYREVGHYIRERAAGDNFYQAWIDTYADESFADATERMIALTDKAALGAGEAERTRMRSRFLRCCQYEWRFWDAAYRTETWTPDTPN